MFERKPSKKVFWLILLGLPFVWFVFAWFAAKILIVEKPLENADAIFVLSGSSAYVERTDKAAELFEQKRAPKIILTNDNQQGGWSPKDNRNPFYWELAQRELIKKSVPAEAIEVLPDQVTSTHDEAVLFAKIAKERNWRSVLLVTSGYHSRRALWTFETVAAESGENVELGVESPPPGQQTVFPAFWWIHRTGWRDVAGEYLKFVYYWLFY